MQTFKTSRTHARLSIQIMHDKFSQTNKEINFETRRMRRICLRVQNLFALEKIVTIILLISILKT